jgi:hypothetical protein
MPISSATNPVVEELTLGGCLIYAATGLPVKSAAKGSLFIRTDGTTTATRLYVNSTGATAWVAITTAS